METLSEFSKILVPVDYSECSLLASRYACKLARLSGAEVLFFHAFYSPAYDLIELTGNKNTQKKLREEVTQKLLTSELPRMTEFRKKLSDYPESRNLNSDRTLSKISPGLASSEIQKQAQEYKPDLIVMGTRGKDKRQNSILGSITEIIIKKIRLPVLAVPENYTFLGPGNLNNILYLTDYDESDFISIRKLIGFASLMKLTIFCLHVGPKADKWEKMKMRGLKEYFASNYDDINVECEVMEQHANLLSSIDEYIREKEVNIISITTRKRNIIEKYFKPSITKRLFYHSNVPLLVFHS
ncbi:MAG: universal stress protein [Bacteroidales bacterium]|nr:universal stress protein [Bacteroidales bacterium]